MKTGTESLDASSGVAVGDVAEDRSISRVTLAVMMLGRLVINMQFRIVYPFLPAICRGLGVSLQTGSLLITARSLVGISSPIYGVLADCYGRRSMMLMGLSMLVAGAGLVAIAPSFGLVLVAFTILGFCRASYEPASQAYVSDRVPYARRGRIMGLLELPWSGSWLIGVPLAGALIAVAGWRSPFAALAGLGVLVLLLTWRLLPSREGRAPAGRLPAAEMRLWLRTAIRTLTRPVLAITSVSALVAMASANIMLIYGTWFEQQFGLALVALGIVSIAVALAELAAESTSAGLVDRLGKRRALLSGISISVAAYLLLPRVAVTLLTGVIGMACVAFASEFCMVSALPLMSELTQEARGTVMATNAALISAGVLVVSLIAPRLWQAGGLMANSSVSAALVLTAGIVLWRSSKAADLER